MRDIVLILFTLCGLAATLRAPYVGLLLWILFSIMNPHQECYSFARTMPWDLIIATVTLGSWLVSSEPKLPPRNIVTWLVLALLVWTTFNMFFGVDPSYSWTYWNRAWKTILMCVLAATLTTNRVRFQALMWTCVISLCYYGVKGGIFTIVTGGHSRVMGPEHTMIEDNNALADALVMILPIMNYLRMQSESRLLRSGVVTSIVLVVTAILGSYSREGYIALASVAGYFWLRTKNKLIYPALAIIVLVPLLKFMPESFYERASTIQNFRTDASFQTRVDSWWVAYRYAMDHIPFGAGFYGMNLKVVWDRYMPGELHAVHSIYFQTLGEQGVAGFVLYLMIIAGSFWNFRTVMRDTKNKPDLAWVHDLASMLQLSLVAFCIGGAAAPMNFFDLLFLWVMLSATLRAMTRKEQVPLLSRGVRVRELQPMPRPLHVPPT